MAPRKTPGEYRKGKKTTNSGVSHMGRPDIQTVRKVKEGLPQSPRENVWVESNVKVYEPKRVPKPRKTYSRREV